MDHVVLNQKSPEHIAQNTKNFSGAGMQPRSRSRGDAGENESEGRDAESDKNYANNQRQL